MSHESTCYSCGVRFFSNYYSSTCPTCVQTRVIEEGQRQAQYASERAYSMTQHHQSVIEDEARKQTQIFLEHNITVKEAYQNGYNWEKTVPGTTSEHQTWIKLNNDGEMEITLLYSAYWTPRLEKQYEKGFVKRFWAEKVSLGENHITVICYNCGKTAKSEFTPAYQFPDTDVYAWADTVRANLTFRTNLSTGELIANFDPSTFSLPEHADAYKLGLEEYLLTTNTLDQNQQRLNEIKEEKRRQDEAQRRANQEEITEILIKTLLWVIGISFVVWLFN